jgi:hypothetical protein
VRLDADDELVRLLAVDALGRKDAAGCVPELRGADGVSID